MRCATCEHENPPGLKFCGECGARLTLLCGACGASNAPTQKYCGACGHKLTHAASAEPIRPQGGADAPTESSLPEGERRYATVVFSDLSGYTALNERLDPGEVESLMGRLKADAARIVEAHGGIVNQFVGDEILALFGISVAQEDDPVQAVRAALALHERARGLSGQVEERIGQPLRLHSGINSGLIVARSRDRRDGTHVVTGDAVNTAARLVGQAAADEIVVSPETQRLVREYFVTEALAPVILKGKAEPVQPYLIVGKTSVATRREAAQKRGLTRYAGREEELALLRKAVERTLAGSGQFATVMGEAGIGKSRLMFEFRHGLDSKAITVLEGFCQARGRETPYLPFVDALRRALNLHEEVPGQSYHDQAVAAIRAISGDFENLIPRLLYLLAIPSEEHVLPAGLQAGELRRALEEALAAYLTTAADRHPLLLILEDWHWADDASVETLKALVALVPRHALMVAVTYRPEYTHAWIAAEHYTPIVIKPLETHNTESMACSVIGTRRLPLGLADHLQARSAGNALFIEELIRSLLEEGAIELRDGDAVLTRSVETIDLPATVQAVIRARVDRLDADTREVLHLASVIGRKFGRRTLEQLFPDQARLDQALDKVVRLGLVQPLRVVPEAAWMFKHALVQEVVYDTLVLERRREIHDLVGAILETIHADRIEEHYESLAHHFSHGSRTEKAVEYLGKSGDKAARYFCLREARGYYNQAIELLEGTPLDSDGKRRYIAIANKWADGSFYSAPARQMVALDRALAFAAELGEPGLETHVTFEIARMHYSLGDMRQAREAFLDFEKRMQSEPNSLSLARARVVFSIVNLYYEKFDEGIDALRKALPVLNAADSPVEVCWAHGMLGNLLGAQGQFRASRGHMDKAYALAISLQSKAGQAQTRVYSSVVSLWQGKIRDALSDAEEAVREGTRIQNSVITSYGLAIRGFTLVLQGNRKEGLEDIERAIEVVREAGTTLGTSFFLGLLSEAHALVGNFQESRRAAREYGKLLELGIHYGEIGASRALGICAARTGDPGWEVYFNRATKLAQLRGSRPELAISRFRYAEALAQLEHMQRATQELDLAESLFREMEMQWWPDRASELRAKLRSPKDQL